MLTLELSSQDCVDLFGTALEHGDNKVNNLIHIFFCQVNNGYKFW